MSPFTMLVKVGEAASVQVVQNGQPALIPKPWTPPQLPPDKDAATAGEPTPAVST